MPPPASAAILLALFAAPAQAVVARQVPGGDAFSGSACSEEARALKDLDIVVYGATGFTGKHATYFLAGHVDKPRWAMAGRGQALNAVAQELGKDHSVEKMWLSMSDAQGLLEMAKRTKVIVSFAGPFESIQGENLIQAALEGCAHYVDVSVETAWKRRMMTQFEPTAQARGLAVVQGAGYQSMVSDLLAVLAAQDFRKETSFAPDSVKILYKQENGGRQGGHLKTVSEEMLHHGMFVDPYILTPDIDPKLRVDTTLDGFNHSYGMQSAEQVYVTQRPAAVHNCPVVRKSLSELYPDAPVSVMEAQSLQLWSDYTAFTKRHPTPPKRVREGEEAAAAAAIFSRAKAQGNANFPLKPNPGEGPPIWVRKEGSFKAEAIATMLKGLGAARKHVTMEGQGDPSSIGTSKMAVTLALGLAEKGPLGGAGGYFTPALALGAEELERRILAIDGGAAIQISHESASD